MRNVAKSGKLHLILTALSLASLVVASPLSQPAAFADAPLPTVKSVEGSVSLSPSIKQIELSSGLIEAKTNLSITNRTGKDLTATLELTDFSAASDSGAISFGQTGQLANKYPLAKWLSLPAGNTVNLPNGKTVVVPVTVKNGDDLTPGGHYGAVIVAVNSDATPANKKVGFKQQLVSLLFVKKAGGEHYGLQLQSLTANTSASSLPATAKLQFKNTGNVHVVPRGYVIVSNNKDEVIKKGIININSNPVLPENSRNYSVDLKSVGSTQSLSNYKVTAYYRYDGQPNFTSQSIYVQSSWRLLPTIIGGIVIALVAALVWRNRRRFTRRKRYAIT